MASFTQDRESVSFSVCNNTVLDVSEDMNEAVTPIVVNGKAVQIKCGDSGARDGKCVIKGGRSHFSLNGNGTTTFLGLTFEGASFASILAVGEADSVATFKECTWRQNDGQAAILINKQNDSAIDIYVDDLVDLVASSSPAMTVLADKCSLENNNVAMATITNIGGHVNLLETIMVNNRESRFGVVAALSGGSVGLSFTCFTGNSATEKGIVFVEKNSTLAFNKNTFGSDNTVGQSDCVNIFIESAGSCADLGSCEGDCQAYESRTCRVTSFTVDSTVSPTTSPTLYPSSIPPTSIKPTSGEGDVEPKELSGDGGSKGGIVAAAIIIPLLLVFLGGAYVVYSRGKTKVNASSKNNQLRTDDENPPGGDGSHSRSKTQDMMDEERSEFEDVDLTQSLTGEDMPQLEIAAIDPSIRQIEDFDDEGPLESIIPLNAPPARKSPRFPLFKALSANSKGSKGSKNSSGDMRTSSPREFVRIPRNLGKKQASKEISSFRELPTTF